MKHYGIAIFWRRLGLLLSALLVLIPGLCLPAQSNISGESGSACRNQIVFAAGYFVNVHSHFYEPFRNRLSGSGSYYHDFQGKYGYEMRAALKLQLKDKSYFGYLSVSPAILVTRMIWHTHYYDWRVGVGPGLGYRYYANAILSPPYSYSNARYHQQELSLMALGETGFDWKIGRQIVKASVLFERHLTSRASRGDFGDTGGFTFLLGLGFRF